MTAQSVVIGSARRQSRGGMFLGFRTVLGKELMEWLRGRAALIIAVVAIAAAVFTTIIPFIAPPTPGVPLLSREPTANVLLGWSGLTAAIIALLSTMSLITGERDRGTLAWSLSQPVSPTSIVVGKWTAAFVVFSIAAVALPLAVSSVVTLAYGSIPDLAMVARFGVPYLTVPAFFIALTITIGTVVRSTAGVAGIAFVVLFLPSAIGALAPVVNEASPTTIAAWAMATATGAPASTLTFAGWLVGMAVLAIGAKLAFDREEF
jgi:ABC-type transport system involved in multi-copper enzyme maturation permease subunit